MNYLVIVWPIIIFSFLILSSDFKDKYFKYVLFLIVFLFSLMVSLRGEQSLGDTGYYVDIFVNSVDIDYIFEGRMAWKGDYFFGFFTYLIRKLSDNYHLFFFVFSLLFLSVLVFSVNKLQLNKVSIRRSFVLISVFMLSYVPFLMFGNTIRQGAAISLSYLALYFLGKNKLLAYIFITFLAVLTHKSAVILIPFVVFYYLPGRLKLLSLILIVSLSVLALNLFGGFFPFLEGKVEFYESNFHSKIDVILIICFFVLFVLVFYKNFIKSTLGDRDVLSSFFYFIIFLAIGFISLEKISSRYLIYIMPILPYFLYLSIISIRQKELIFQLFFVLVVCFSFLMMFAPQVQNIMVWS
jgi:hypothetical protein